MPGMGWLMGLGILHIVLITAVLILGNAALIKYLRSGHFAPAQQ